MASDKSQKGSREGRGKEEGGGEIGGLTHVQTRARYWLSKAFDYRQQQLYVRMKPIALTRCHFVLLAERCNPVGGRDEYSPRRLNVRVEATYLFK